MLVELFEHAKVLADGDERGSFVRKLDLDAPYVSRVLPAARFVVLDCDFLNGSRLVSRQIAPHST